jgi:hypothetical protein
MSSGNDRDNGQAPPVDISARASDEGFSRATLEFVSRTGLEGYLAAARRLHEGGARRFRLRAPGSQAALAQALSGRLTEHFSEITCCVAVDEGASHGEPAVATAGGSEAVFLLEHNASALSTALMEFIDVPASIVAPITEHYFRRRALFMITVPKSGTHMLFELLGAFQLTNGGLAEGPLSPDHFYFLSSQTSHTPAPEFFKSLVSLPERGAGHPFFATPTIFMYRNPLDIVVSEAFYLGERRNTPLAGFYSQLKMEDRLLRLIGEDPLVGSLRQRLGHYVPWLRLPNVIPISFEELVGPKGDGSLAEQLKTIWSLQLKLQIPGSPAWYAGAVFQESTRTFRKGAINSHREYFTEECYAALRRLEQDVFHEFGYSLDDRFIPGYLPRFARSFRRRPLQVGFPEQRPGHRDSIVEAAVTPCGAVLGYRGYLIAKAGKVFAALPATVARPIDPRLEAGGPRLRMAASWEDMLETIDAAPLTGECSPPQIIAGMENSQLFRSDPRPATLAEANVCGFNIVQFDNRFYCMDQTSGPMDVQWDDTTGVFVALTLEEARAWCLSRAPAVEEPLPPGTSIGTLTSSATAIAEPVAASSDVPAPESGPRILKFIRARRHRKSA